MYVCVFPSLELIALGDVCGWSHHNELPTRTFHGDKVHGSLIGACSIVLHVVVKVLVVQG